jgi:hypothetical protein
MARRQFEDRVPAWRSRGITPGGPGTPAQPIAVLRTSSLTSARRVFQRLSWAAVLEQTLCEEARNTPQGLAREARWESPKKAPVDETLELEVRR